MTQNSSHTPLFLNQIDLHQFRSYPELRLHFDQQVTLLIGPNGIGKTNILEAISLLGSGNGLRKAKLLDLLHQPLAVSEQNAWSINGKLTTKEGPTEFSTFLSSTIHEQDETSEGEEQRHSRHIKIDQKMVNRQSEVDDLICIVALTPQMERLFCDEPHFRRRFLDHMICSYNPHYSHELSLYNKAMRDRAKILKFPKQDERWLSIIEKQIVNHGVSIAAERVHFLSEFQSFLNQLDTSFLKPIIRMQGIIEEKIDQIPALLVEEQWLNELEKSRIGNIHLAAAHMPYGPHRSDLCLKHPQKNMLLAHCSTGEQKSFLLSLTLAFIRFIQHTRQYTPIVLLDEVGSHLDKTRKIQLFEEVVSTKAQTFITATESNVFDDFFVKACYYDLQTMINKRV